MKGTPTWLRAQNDRTAFRLLLAHGPLSPSQLGELSGLSKPTAGQMIARLERVGLIGPAGGITGARGPNAVSYGVRRDSLTGVAVSILADQSRPSWSIRPMPITRWPRSRRPDCSDRRPMTSGGGPGRRCGVRGAVGLGQCGDGGRPGAVDAAGDASSFTETLPGSPLQGAGAMIEAATGLEVTLEKT